jgi:hypothetical protein
MKFTGVLLFSGFVSTFAEDGNMRGVSETKEKEVLLIPRGTDRRTLSEEDQRLLGVFGDDFDCMDCACQGSGDGYDGRYCDCVDVCDETTGTGKGSKGSSGKGVTKARAARDPRAVRDPRRVVQFTLLSLFPCLSLVAATDSLNVLLLAPMITPDTQFCP